MILNRIQALIAVMAVTFGIASAEVTINEETFGNSLGGWKKRGKQAAEYALSGTTYRTYRPEISPTPDGGIFASVRIDHVRGWLSSDDHAMLEVTINSQGTIVSAQSTIAIQGRSISSDVILGGNAAGQQLAPTERAVQIGTDLVADLSAKLLREKIVEAGRVSFPAALRHNYNLLFRAIRVENPASGSAPAADEPADPANPVATPVSPNEPSSGQTPAKDSSPDDPATPAVEIPENKPLEIRPYATPKSADLPTNG